MADGDYERGRGHEIAAIAARLRKLAAARSAVPPPADSAFGSSCAPDILVLNGWASSSHAWDLCRFMSRSSVRLFSYVDQLDRLPERRLDVSTSKVILVGWSMGGSSALRLACRYPDRIVGLVLLAATPRMMEEKASGWRGMNARRLEALRKGLEITHGEGFFGVPEGKPNPYMVDASENLERGLGYLLETDVRADLERVFGSRPYLQTSIHSDISFPVHIFQSERDGIVRPENAAYLKTVFPQARVTMIPGTEHALPIQIPQEIDDAVDACLTVAAQGKDS